MPGGTAPGGWPERASELLRRVGQRRPLVHHVTNLVTMHAVANVTLAVGALPVMALAPEEIPEIAEGASCVVINLGTPTLPSLQAAQAAMAQAARRGLPVVVDPVGVAASRWRLQAAQRLLAYPLAAVRANPAEAAALAGEAASDTWVQRGVESVVRVPAAATPARGPAGEQGPMSPVEARELARRRDVACALARRVRATAAVTGPVDLVASPPGEAPGERGATLEVFNGHPWFSAVSGSGCMATAVVAAFVAVSEPEHRPQAVACALAVYGLAGERAAARCPGPGTFLHALVDELHALAALARQGEAIGGVRVGVV